MSQATDTAAIKAAIDAQFTTPRAVDMSEAKTATKDHVIVIVSRRFVPERRHGGDVMIPGGRVVTRYVTLDDGNISVIRERTKAALENQILSGDLGPFVFEAEVAMQDDDNWYTSADSWTF